MYNLYYVHPWDRDGNIGSLWLTNTRFTYFFPRATAPPLEMVFKGALMKTMGEEREDYRSLSEA